MNVISSCRLLLGQTIKTKLKTKLTNNISVGDVIRVIDGAIEAQQEPR